MHVYVVGTGIYMQIYHFLVHTHNELVLVVIWLDHDYDPLCVLVRAQVISSALVPHKYWDIYENHKHLYLTFLIWRICGRKLTHMVIISDRHYHCVYIPIRVRVITYACICCRYWDIYANISFSCAHTQWTCFSSYLTWSWLWSLMCTGTCSGNIICTCTS